MSRLPPDCRYCGESLELVLPVMVGKWKDVQAKHAAVNCPRAPWLIQPGWQAVALVHAPWWRRLLGR